jgi:methionyl-tRNA synthetase
MDKELLESLLFMVCNIARISAVLLQPYSPSISREILKELNVQNDMSLGIDF